MPWPLTAANVAGYTAQDALPVRRTPMEKGPDRVTRISTDYTTQFSGQWVVNESQLASYRSFLQGEAAHGAAWFAMPLVTTSGVTAHQVRIVGSSISAIGAGLYQLQLGFETREHIA